MFKFLSCSKPESISAEGAAPAPVKASAATIEAAKAFGFVPVHHMVCEEGPCAGAWVWSPRLILGASGSSMKHSDLAEVAAERARIQSAGGRVLRVIDPRGDHLAEQRMFVALGSETMAFNPFATFASEPERLLELAEAMVNVTLTTEQHASAKRVGLTACVNSSEPSVSSLVEVWRLVPELAEFANALGKAAIPGYV